MQPFLEVGMHKYLKMWDCRALTNNKAVKVPLAYATVCWMSVICLIYLKIRNMSIQVTLWNF